VQHHAYAERGDAAVCAGRVRLVHRRTRRVHELTYAAVHLGGLDVVGALRPAADPAADERAVDDLIARWRGGERITALLRRIVEGFGPEEFGLSAALPGSDARILDRTARALTDRFASEFERLLADHHRSLTALAEAGYSLPPELRLPVELALSRRLRADLVAIATGDQLALASAEQAVADALEAGVPLAGPAVGAVAVDALDHLVDRAIAGEADAAAAAIELVDLLSRAGVGVRIDRAQERVYEALLAGAEGPLVDLGRALGLAVDRLGVPT